MSDYQERDEFSLTGCDSQLSADEEELLDELGLKGAARREFLGQGVNRRLGLSGRGAFSG